ncbi:MAG TPA: diguanylate cyclase [Sideroxyarcus sp.]|nr:diguanylate cyclase [Sideroxyarcus sp.]
MPDSNTSQVIQQTQQLYFKQFAMDFASVEIYWISADARICYANKKSCESLGYSKQELLQLSIPDIDPTFPIDHWISHWDSLKRDKSQTFETQHRRKNGEIFPVEVEANYVQFGDLEYNVAYCKDITRRKQNELALQLSERNYRALMEQACDAIFVADNKGQRYLDVNEAACRMLGYTREELLGLGIRDVMDPEEIAREPIRFADMWAGKVINMQRRHRRKDGSFIEVELNARMLPDGRLQAIVRDVTARKAAEDQIYHLAHFDSLTDLPNRALLYDRLHQATALARRNKTRMALLFVDLDEFKPVNDHLGHEAGDLLLAEAARRMRECVRDSDTLARMGGDEFVVLLPSIEKEQDAEAVSGKILDALGRPFECAGERVGISASIGIALYPEDAADGGELLKHADAAMYRAKASGRNRSCFFAPRL